jgi:hypothetical protein
MGKSISIVGHRQNREGGGDDIHYSIFWFLKVNFNENGDSPSSSNFFSRPGRVKNGKYVRRHDFVKTSRFCYEDQ